VTGKIPLILNLFLAAFLASILFSMYTELSGDKTVKRKPSEYVFHKLDRPSAVKTEGFAKIFDADSSPAASSNSPKQGNGSEDALNELIAGDEVIRVQGIFLTEDAAFAIISITGKKKKKKQEVLKVGAGDTLKGFRVTLIEQDAVQLSGPSSRTAVLRIFSKDDP